MPVLKRRTRIVSFRLSEEEYEALMSYCVANGARSVSDYARIVACRPLDNGKASAADKKSERSIRRLKNRVDELHRVIQRLTLQIDSHRPLEGEPVGVNATGPDYSPPLPFESGQRRDR